MRRRLTLCCLPTPQLDAVCLTPIATESSTSFARKAAPFRLPFSFFLVTEMAPSARPLPRNCQPRTATSFTPRSLLLPISMVMASSTSPSSTKSTTGPIFSLVTATPISDWCPPSTQPLNSSPAISMETASRTCCFPSGPTVALGNGDGTFGPFHSYAELAYYGATCAYADVEGIGHVDAICGYLKTNGTGDITGGSALIVLHGNSDGSFNTTPIASQNFGDQTNEYNGFGTFQFPVAMKDVNGDGTLDIIAYAGDGYSILLGGPGLHYSYPTHFAAGYFSGTVGNGYSDFAVQYADMDGDGLPDIVAVGPNGVSASATPAKTAHTPPLPPTKPPPSSATLPSRTSTATAFPISSPAAMRTLRSASEMATVRSPPTRPCRGEASTSARHSLRPTRTSSTATSTATANRM